MDNRSDRQTRPAGIMLGAVGSIVLFVIALALGGTAKGMAATMPILIPAIFLEVIIGAAASIPLGFDPISGAMIAALGNLVPAPFLIAGFDSLVNKWTWLRNKLERAEKISEKYGKYGVWILAPLAPFIGVYVGIAVGVGLRFRPLLIMASLSLGVFVAAFLTTFGGEGIKALFMF